ncbi:SDR family oxidoreductase [Corynebacterium aquatimens]|uniref:SDR family oxidoreductase n=1 Tax=Corynebacterium aquatimens TaxID=1190508 RepID=UPI00338DCF9A
MFKKRFSKVPASAVESALRGNYAVVTGAASGIGKEVALQLAAKGWRVAITDINAEGLNATVKEIRTSPGEVIDATPVDISDHEAVDTWARALEERFGAAHTIHHVGGISMWGAVDLFPLEKWQKLIDVNLMGTVHVIRAFTPSMMKAGPVDKDTKRAIGPRRLACVSSSAGIIGLPWHAAYSASKAGVLGMLEVLRFDLAPYGITVHAVAPGAVDSQLVHSIDIHGIDQSQKRVRLAKEAFQRHAISPAKCAEIILRDVDKGKYLIATSADIKVGRWAQVNAPFAYKAVLTGINKAFQWAAKDAWIESP